MNIGGEAAGQPEVYHTSWASECKYPDFHGYSKVRVGAESVHRIARIERERRQLFVSFAQFDAVSPDVDVAILISFMQPGAHPAKRLWVDIADTIRRAGIGTR